MPQKKTANPSAAGGKNGNATEPTKGNAKTPRQTKASAPKIRPDTKAGKGQAKKSSASLRAKDAARKKAERAAATVVKIPKCKDRDRRKRLEQDDIAWLMYYFGGACELDDPFTYDFTGQQIEMVKAIGHALEFGDDQALAASRGEGKTTITERLILKYHLQGKVDYSVIFQASAELAENCLDSIKTAIERNVLLRQDYPEVCIPVIALEGASQRAGTQRVSGHRHDTGKAFEMASSKFTWSGDEIIFPDVPGSPSARSIIATRGLDATVRGLKKRGKRPKIAVIDDPDTEDTSRSREQAEKLEMRIEAAIGGLGGQRKRIGRVIISTIQSPISVSALYTDPKRKPTFKGRRFRFLITKPSRMDIWEDYVEMWKEDFEKGDEHCRRSCKFYLDNREDMDAGGVVSNQNRFDPSRLPDGTQLEYSALQHYFNLKGRLKPGVVEAEYDNDPIIHDAIVEDDLKPSSVQKKVNGFDRCIIPDGCILLTQGIDVRKRALHWVVRAWKADGTGFTIDYGVFEVLGTSFSSDEGVDQAIQRAVLSRLEEAKMAGYRFDNGEKKDIDLTLVDAGWKTSAIYGACVIAGLGVLPVMGFGKSSGCVQANFHDAMKSTVDRKAGDRWFLSRKQKFVKFETKSDSNINEVVSRLWLVCADADHWKGFEHDRWKTGIDSDGSMSVFGIASDDGERMSKDQRDHHSYARHICNEQEVERMHKGVLIRRWEAKSENTHWLDASYYSNVAASIKGIRIGGAVVDIQQSSVIKAAHGRPQKQRKSLADLASEAKHG
jgi:hypothetical protein